MNESSPPMAEDLPVVDSIRQMLNVIFPENVAPQIYDEVKLGKLHELLSSREFVKALLALRPSRGYLAEEIYKGLLGRPADAAGFEGVLSLSPDIDLSEILESFVQSDEFEERFEVQIKNRSITEVAFSPDIVVRAVYRGMLNRDVELKGLSDCVDALRNGVTIDSLIAELVRSEEFKKRFVDEIENRAAEQVIISPDRLVSAVYRSLFNRDAEARGVEIYGAALRNGMTPEALITELVNSSESRYAPRGDRSELLEKAVSIETLRDICEALYECIVSKMMSRGCVIQISKSAIRNGSPDELARKVANLICTIDYL